jgi:NTP pyrophosphatase (non-canonical NTP hydrolase)
MEFSEYQHRLDTLERECGWERVLPSHTFVHMVEEMGEIARLLECMEGYRESDRSPEALRADLAGELADLTGLIVKLANQHNIDIDAAMQAHLIKFVGRTPDKEECRREMARYMAYQERNLAWVKGESELGA